MYRYLLIFILLQTSVLAGQNAAVSVDKGYKKLSPGSQLFAAYSGDAFLFHPDQNGRVSALVQVLDANTIPEILHKPYAVYGNVLSVILNRDELMELARDPNVSWIEVSFRLNRVRMLNDTTRILSHVNEVQNGLSNGLPVNYLGTGVIAGIVDIGFQPDNPTFLSADGSALRIKRYWHQSNKSGSAPAGFSYGTEFSALTDIVGSRDDDGTHATHVAGITAGSGYTTTNLKYRGMAPDADLVFVSIKYANDTLGGSASGDYIVANPNILDAYKYIFDYAQSVGKPAVCNLSWGMHTGPHDGNSLFDKAVENLTGPGKIVVGAAGNDAGNQMHVTGKLNNDTLYTFAIDRSRNDYVHENIYVDAWGDSAKTLALNISLLDTFGNLLLETPFFFANAQAIYKQVVHNGPDSVWITMAGNASFVNNKKPEILLSVESNHASYQRIRLGFTGNGEFHAWNSGQTYRWTAGGFLNVVRGNDRSADYLNGTQSQSISENGGTGKATITAGSYIARNNWIDFNGVYHAQNWLQVGEVSGFSGRGNTVDGRLKPDISAPGQLVASSVNYRTFAGWMGENSPYKSTYNGNDQYWTLFSGTSMASPHVAGIVALMLQANPNLGPFEIRSILKTTATHDAFTGSDSNIHYGYGKINALAAVKRVVQLRTESNTLPLEAQLFPNPANHQLHIWMPAASEKNVELFIADMTGKTCFHRRFRTDAFGGFDADISTISDGVYVYKIQSGGSSNSGKLLIRH